MSRSMQTLKNQTSEEFLNSVSSELDALEHVRLDKLAAYNARKVMGKMAAIIGCPVTLLIDFFMFFGRGDDNAAGLTILFLGGLYYWVRGPVREYIKAYKKRIMPRIARTLGDLSYDPDGKLLVKGRKGTKIVPRYNRNQVEDYFTGTYKGTSIEISEMTLRYKSGSGKNSSTRTVFKGLGLLIDVPKKFYGHTIMLPNQSGVVEWFKEKTTGLERANLVSPQFENKYDVYTNDQVEARYLIHPNVIEKFSALAQRYKGKGGIRAAYYQSQLLLLVPSDENHFEPADIEIPAASPESVLAMRDDLLKVLDIVDELELIDEKQMELDKQVA